MAGLGSINVTSAIENGTFTIDFLDGAEDAEWSYTGDTVRHNPVWEISYTDNTSITGLGQGDLPNGVVPSMFAQSVRLRLYAYVRQMQYDPYTFEPTGFGPWNLQNFTDDFFIQPNATFNSVTAIATDGSFNNKQFIINFDLTEQTSHSVKPQIKIDESGEIAGTIYEDDLGDGYFWYPDVTPGSTIAIKVYDIHFPDVVYGLSDPFVVNGIQLLSPSSGDKKVVGDTNTYINWQSAGTSGFLDILYSYDGGSFNVIASNVDADDEAYQWTVPNTVSSEVQILIRDSSDHSVFALSVIFAIVSKKLVFETTNVQNLTAGGNFTFDWFTFGSIPNVTLIFREINSNTNTPFFNQTITIAENISNTDSYIWTVPDADTLVGGTVTIYDATDDTVYATIETINISGTQRLVLTDQSYSPQRLLYSKFAKNATTDIRVLSTGTFSSVTYYVSSDGGDNYTSLGSIGNQFSNFSFTPSSKTYNRLKAVIHPAELECESDIFEVQDILIQGVNNFGGTLDNLNNDIAVTDTIPGILGIGVGSSGISAINIYLSTDGGDNYDLLFTDNSPWNGQSLSGVGWAVPNINTSQAIIKLEKTTDPTVFGTSDIFSIQPTPVIRVYPTTANITSVSVDGQPKTFTFAIYKYQSYLENFNIYLSLDGGSTYPITLISNFAPGASPYLNYSPTFLPEHITETAKIKVELVSNPTVFVETQEFVIKGFKFIYPEDEDDLVIGDLFYITWVDTGNLISGVIQTSFDSIISSGQYTKKTEVGSTVYNNRLNWIVQGLVTDDAQFYLRNGFGTEKSYQNFNILAASENSDPVLATNTTLTLLQKGTKIITNNFLSVTDEEQSATEIVYTLTTVPTRGVLLKNNVALVASDTFTQDDIDNNLISYRHTSGTLDPVDNFTFTVSDENGGTIEETSFNISIKLTSLVLNIVSRLLKFKT